MTDHARLSASGSKRWSTCPGSVAIEANCPDPGSDYAAEGTCAHWIASAALRDNLTAAAVQGLPEMYNQYDSPELRDFVQGYIDYIRAIPGEHFYEARVDYGQWVPDGFGTSDFIGIESGLLTVTDLKFGKGVQEFAEENTQMILYALGALAFASSLYEIDRVKMTIYQPRLDHIDSWECTVPKLLEWAEFLRKRALLTLAPDAPRIPSAAACRFCRAKAICPERAQGNMALAQEEFGMLPKPAGLNLVELGQILLRIDDFEQWVTDVKEYALRQAITGQRFPGMKLVEGRSNRKWKDVPGAVKYMTGAGLKPDQIYQPREIVGVTEAERLVGKDWKDVLNEFMVKPQGKPVLVAATDRRKEYAPKGDAAEDFK